MYAATAGCRFARVPTLTLEAVIAWLDAGQPDPDRAAERIGGVLHAVIQAAQ